MVKWLSALTAPKFFEISRISSADGITELSLTMLVKGVPDHSRISYVWSSGVQLNDALLSQVFSPANVPHHPRLSSNSVTPELLNSFPELFRRRFYVVLVVDSERSHQDAIAVGAGRIFFDRIFTHTTSFERFTHLAFHLACRQQIGGVIRQVAEVAEVP